MYRASVTLGGDLTALPEGNTIDALSPGYGGERGPGIASNGTGYAVVYPSEPDGNKEAVVDVGPSIASAPTASPAFGAGGWIATDVAIATDGAHYFAVYDQPNSDGTDHVAGMLVDSAGNVMATPTIAETGIPTYATTVTSIAWNGTTYAVSWLQAGPDSASSDQFAALYDASGNVVWGPASVTGGATAVTEQHVACGAGACVFVWNAGGLSTRAFDAQGNALGAAVPIAGTSGFHAPRLAWDGTEYVLVAEVTEVGPHDVVAQWLDPKGTPLGTGFTTVAAADVSSIAPLGIAADGARHAFVTFTEFSTQGAVSFTIAPTPPPDPDAGPDAGTDAGDAGADSGPDAARSDGGDAGSSTAHEGGGCGCSMPGESSPAPLPIAGLALVVPLCLRRRRAALR